MSHGKVIKNRSLGLAHSLKVYIIFLLLSLYRTLLFVFTPFSAKVFVSLVFFFVFFSVSLIEKHLFIHCEILHSSNLIFQNKGTGVLDLYCVSHSSAYAVVMHFIIGAELSIEKSNGLTFKKNEFRFNGCVHLKKKVQHTAIARRTMPYICFVVMPPFLIHTYKKCCVQDFLLFTWGAF